MYLLLYHAPEEIDEVIILVKGDDDDDFEDAHREARDMIGRNASLVGKWLIESESNTLAIGGLSFLRPYIG